MSETPEHFTTKADRRRAQQEASRALHRCAGEANVDFCDIADACAITESKVSKWGSAREGSPNFTFADMTLMPRSVAVALIRHAATQQGMGVFEMHAADATEGHLAAITAFIRESGDVTNGALEAVADGTIDKAEARRILPEIHEAIEKLVALKHLFVAIGEVTP